MHFRFSLWNLGLGAPAIAAGENLNLPVVGGRVPHAFRFLRASLVLTIAASKSESLALFRMKDSLDKAVTCRTQSLQ